MCAQIILNWNWNWNFTLPWHNVKMIWTEWHRKAFWLFFFMKSQAFHWQSSCKLSNIGWMLLFPVPMPQIWCLVSRYSWISIWFQPLSICNENSRLKKSDHINAAYQWEHITNSKQAKKIVNVLGVMPICWSSLSFHTNSCYLTAVIHHIRNCKSRLWHHSLCT